MRALLVLALIVGSVSASWHDTNESHYSNKLQQEERTNASSSESDSSSSSESASSSSDSSSSSSSVNSNNHFQPKPWLHLPPNSPLLPYFIGFKGNTIQASQMIDGVNAALKRAQQIASELQNPNAITGQHTLTKFNILTKIIRTMRDHQIEEVGEKLYFPKTSTDANKYLAWTAFRDAVAQAGTGPALEAIKRWIQNNKVQGEEAAELLAVLPHSVRYPTRAYIETLYTLVTRPKVTKQMHLNSTAIHVFTDLIRLVQHSNEQHKRFPIHSFGNMVSKRSLQHFSKLYLPYLSQQLNHSVAEGDSKKIQVFIRALGNTAHPEILGILEPYLEGRRNISNFQRLVIVALLDRMTQVHPKLVRNVLYKIYQNSRETPEIRVAAVMQLMKAQPPAEMLQRMAQYTNMEHSKQVNSAVKSAIESAAQLNDIRFQKLAMNAKSAVNFLTPRQYGLQYSKHYLRNFISKHLSNSLKLTSIQSKDSVLPSSIFYVLGRSIGGFTQPCNRFVMMTSSTDELMNMLSNQFGESEKPTSELPEGEADEQSSSEAKSQSQWSTEKISNMLNISFEEADQAEGNIRITWAGVDRFFTFDNNTLKQLPLMIRDAASSLRNNKSFNYTKMFNQQTIKTGLPTIMGLPFIYSLQVPTVISFGGESQLKSNPDLSNGSEDHVQLPQTLNATSDIKIMYASKTQSKISFVTPFDHQHYIAGYDSGMQVHLPLRVKVDVDMENANVGLKLQPLNPNAYQKMAEYSTLAYTTKHNILDLSPPQLDENAEIVHVRPVQRFEMTAGQENTGFAFDLNVETEQKHFDYAYFMEGIEKQNFISALWHYNKDQVIKPFTNYTLAFNPHKTTAQSAKIIVNYDNKGGLTYTDSLPINEHHNGAIPSKVSSNSQKRLQEFLSRASSGIQDVSAQAVDVSVEFNGETHAQYIATAAYGRSSTSIMSRLLVFLSKDPAKTTSENRPYQIAVDAVTKSPKVPLIHYRKAVEANPKSFICATIHFGEKVESGGHMKLRSLLSQSREYVDYLEQLPTAIECEKQMLTGNNILPACRNVTARANLLDQYSLSAEYSQLPDVFKNMTYKAYSFIREVAYPYVSDNMINLEHSEGQAALNVSFSPDLNSANVSVDTSILKADFTNLRMGEVAKAIAVIHPEYNVAQRIGQMAMLSQQFPTCAIDKKYATTFDNTTYPINLGKCWHVMMQPTHSNHKMLTKSSFPLNNVPNFSVLVRDVAPSQREVMMVLDEDIVNLIPYSGLAADEFMVNGQKYTVSKDSTTHYKNKDGVTVVKAYKLPSGEIRLVAPMHGFEIFYDGLRVKFQIPNGYRNKVLGLCGDFNGEKITDFTTPKNCMLKNALEFAATYALIDESCEGPAIELRQRSQTASCNNNTITPGDVISDQEISKRLTQIANIQNYSSNKVRRQKNKTTCGVFRILIIYRGGLKCYSKKPQLTCLGACHQPVTRTPKQLEFSCQPEREAGIRIAFPLTIPDLSKSINKTENVWIPLQCA